MPALCLSSLCAFGFVFFCVWCVPVLFVGLLLVGLFVRACCVRAAIQISKLRDKLNAIFEGAKVTKSTNPVHAYMHIYGTLAAF